MTRSDWEVDNEVRQKRSMMRSGWEDEDEVRLVVDDDKRLGGG